MQSYIFRSFFKFSTLTAQYSANKSKNAVRFQSQNQLWDFQQLNYHTMAFAKGLSSLSFGSNDTILIRVPTSQQTEAYVSILGSAYIGVNVVKSNANNVEQLDRQIQQNNARALIFQPTLPLGDASTLDGLYNLMPENQSLIQGQKISPKRYSNLSYLIQTGFYSHPGVFKYRSILNYASDKYYSISENSKQRPLELPSSNYPLLITDPAHSFAFKAAILNSVVNGRYVVCAQALDIRKICNAHNNKIEVVATQDLDIPKEVKVFIESGSTLLSNHGNRVQL